MCDCKQLTFLAWAIFGLALGQGTEESNSTFWSREKRSFYKSGKLLENETSRTLDYLLNESGYNKRVRPQFGGGPDTVFVNMAIRSIGPVDENNGIFSLDCYFRQSWMDQRLRYNTSGLKELALNWAFLAKIWKPDTFFLNGKQSFLHKITVPNRFVRISPSGKVSYSQRLTIMAACPMNLRKFPLDSQICKLEIGSFGYTGKELLYRWQKEALSIDDDVSMAQFHLTNWTYTEKMGYSGLRTRYGLRNDSTVQIDFYFERLTGFFLLQIYTPLTLIVFCSWVSFWLVKTEKGGEVPARTALGATTVLSIVNLGFGGKSKPKVGYSTALDIYIILCFMSVFAALVEFASINFIDTFIKRFREWEEEQKKTQEINLTKVKDGPGKLEAKDEKNVNNKVSDLVDGDPKFELTGEDKAATPPLAKSECVSTVSTQDACVSTEDEFEDIEVDEKKESRLEYLLNIYDRIMDRLFKRIFRKYSPNIVNMYIYSNTLDVIYDIDEWARRLFPLAFLMLQLLYWSSYLYIF